MDKTKVLFAVVITLLISITTLQALDNYMNVMTFMAGEFAGSEFGESMASLDFNGDGYMDLVISSGAWNPDLTFNDQNRWGKLYFYWGGPNFDNVADYVIPGAYNWQMGPYASIYNAGDVNGDAIDDLVVLQTSQDNEDFIAIYFGGQTPLVVPSVLLTYPDPEISWVKIVPIGDINGDHRDDIAIIKRQYPITTKVTIMVDYQAQPLFLYQTNNTWTPFLSGIGDVNGDGFDDCILHKPINSTGQTNNKLILYYGSPNFPVTDSLVICEDSNSIIKKWACPFGDVNGDGLADFTAGSLVYDYRQNLWLGGNNLTPQWDVVLEATFLDTHHNISERGTGYPFVHGDVNGDGYQDVFGFNSEAGYYSGNLFLWMGSPNMNGSVDFGQMSVGGYDCSNFGWSKVTGDFNADGYCDVAVGAPWFGYNDHINTGRVYILAGNPDLHETTVALDDELAPVLENIWELNTYPNPVRGSSLNIAISKAEDTSKNPDQVSLYNLKGQLVMVSKLRDTDWQKGTIELNIPDIPNGVYLVRLSDNRGRHTSKKIVIAK